MPYALYRHTRAHGPVSDRTEGLYRKVPRARSTCKSMTLFRKTRQSPELEAFGIDILFVQARLGF